MQSTTEETAENAERVVAPQSGEHTPKQQSTEASEAAPALNEESGQAPPNNEIQNAEKTDNEEHKQEFPQDSDNGELQDTEEVDTENGAGGVVTPALRGSVPSGEATAEDASAESEEQTEEELAVYRKHGFRGQWEDPRAVASEARSLYAGELSRVISTKKAFRLFKVDRKRTYRGELYFYGADQYSYDRKKRLPYRKTLEHALGTHTILLHPLGQPTGGTPPHQLHRPRGLARP